MPLEDLGCITLADLAGICKLMGLEYLPYPFFTRAWLPQTPEHADSIVPRFAHGDLSVFRHWIHSYANADIWLECQVHYVAADVAATRIMACRANQFGYVASQRPDDDVVDVFAVSPLEIGPAVIAAAGPVTPGAHDRIVAPPCFVDLRRDDNRATDEGDGGYEFSLVPVAPQRRAATVVSRSDVEMMAVVQSHCTPARAWGLTRDNRAVCWVGVTGDGHYAYTDDFTHATPATEQVLSGRVNRLLAEDVRTLRQRRPPGEAVREL